MTFGGVSDRGVSDSGVSDRDEVCTIAQELIRIDTSNFGAGRAVGELKAAEYVATLLDEVGLSADLYEAAPGRVNLVARWAGSDPTLPALLLHGHLDVVPADPEQWSVDPFGGVIADGMLWGRGAVDMKGMDAMILASVRDLIRRGEQPRRDIVIAFFADEEDTHAFGSAWMVQQHPEVFAGVAEAISEVGGYSVAVNGNPVFLIQTGEKGQLWLRLHARGRASHASMLTDQNAILDLADAIVRIGREPWPVSLTATTAGLIERLREIGDFAPETDPVEIASSVGTSATAVVPGLRNVANVTMFSAGYKSNVIPESASALVDVRVLPGQRDEVLARIRQIVGPDIEIEIENDIEGTENSFDTDLVDAMARALRGHCPGAQLAPYLMPAGTDNALLAGIGIRGYGFAPLLLPADFDFPAMFHGVDERVPLSALSFGTAVLTDLLRSY